MVRCDKCDVPIEPKAENRALKRENARLRERLVDLE